MVYLFVDGFAGGSCWQRRGREREAKGVKCEADERIEGFGQR
jgi:hypothetical protein